MTLTSGMPKPGSVVGKFEGVMRWVAPGIGVLIGLGVGWILPLPAIVKKIMIKAGFKEGGDTNILATLISGMIFLGVGAALIMKFDNPVIGLIGGVLAGIGMAALWFGFTVM